MFFHQRYLAELVVDMAETTKKRDGRIGGGDCDDVKKSVTRVAQNAASLDWFSTNS